MKVFSFGGFRSVRRPSAFLFWQVRSSVRLPFGFCDRGGPRFPLERQTMNSIMATNNSKVSITPSRLPALINKV
ncbi:hypothetical protein [cf. Phormidesmis sp. LEGE 11477]|uniref:hypothetical protein n=1 Tax=cf. Phormidesmis sp. LEGE 11477 TaxID=1828680 RepID=UPI0018826991|nr:hypothetical protein [cf. Phormidesmis sp. LEGE 11477]MBE9064917.1 hypothetical protein [cf. Phormidesmis sp. LEGE 11477]